MLKAIKKLTHGLDSQKLSMTEKAEMRSALLSFVQKNPTVRNHQPSRHISTQGPLSFNSLTHNYMMATIIIALILGVSGGTSLAAEHSLPGDILYPIKVEVNENIRSTVAFSTKAKVDWETEKVERRLEEIEQLKVKNRLTVGEQTRLQNALHVQIEKVTTLTERFDSNDQTATANSRLEAILKSHAQILLVLSGMNAQMADIALDVAERTKVTTDNRIEAEQKLSVQSQADVKTAAEGKMKAAENKIAQVKKFVGSTTLTAETKAQVDATLQLADAAMIQGQTKLAASLYAEAFVKFQESMRLAQEAQIIAAMAHKLDIDLHLKVNDSATTANSATSQNDTVGANTHIEVKVQAPITIDKIIDTANQIKLQLEVGGHSTTSVNVESGTSSQQPTTDQPPTDANASAKLHADINVENNNTVGPVPVSGDANGSVNLNLK